MLTRAVVPVTPERTSALVWMYRFAPRVLRRLARAPAGPLWLPPSLPSTWLTGLDRGSDLAGWIDRVMPVSLCRLVPCTENTSVKVSKYLSKHLRHQPERDRAHARRELGRDRRADRRGGQAPAYRFTREELDHVVTTNDELRSRTGVHAYA
ncbi:hypothetical protein SVIOM342S_06418 [Streptomyces violaceorubidus]